MTDWELIRAQLRLAVLHIESVKVRVTNDAMRAELVIAKDAIEHAWGHMPPECGQEDGE